MDKVLVLYASYYIISDHDFFQALLTYPSDDEAKSLTASAQQGRVLGHCSSHNQQKILQLSPTYAVKFLSGIEVITCFIK